MKLKLPYGLMAAALGLSLMTACGPDDDSNNEDNQPLTSDQVFARTTAAFVNYQCKTIFQCPETLGFAIEDLGRFKDEADCKATLTARLELGSEVNDAITSGRVKYDASFAEACLTKFETLYNGAICKGIEAIGDEPTECEQLFVGQVADGEKCLSSQECSGELRCNFEGGECYGVCKADPCAACTDAQYCDRSGDAPACKDRAPVGADCTYFQDTCVETASCFYADLASETGKCVADKSVDDGGDCDDDDQCKSGLCSFDGVCEEAGAAPELGAAGAMCDELTLCKPGLSCQDINADSGEGVCKTLAVKDAECDYNEQCEFELFCQGATETTKGKCADRLANGQDCTYSADCQSDTCDGNTNKCVGEMMCSI